MDIKEIERHSCLKSKGKGDIFKRYYDHNTESHVNYCHYCGEHVSGEEYTYNLEWRFNSQREALDKAHILLEKYESLLDVDVIAERDRYREALQRITLHEKTFHREYAHTETLKIAQSALKG